MLAAELRRVGSAKSLIERARRNAEDGESVLVVVEFPQDRIALTGECLDGYEACDEGRIEGCALYSAPGIPGGITVCPAYSLPALAALDGVRFRRAYLLHINVLHPGEVRALLDLADPDKPFFDIEFDAATTRIGLFPDRRKDGGGDE